MQPEALSVQEAAWTIGVSRSNLYRLFDEGGLPYIKIGKRRLVLRSDLIAWLESKHVSNTKPA